MEGSGIIASVFILAPLLFLILSKLLSQKPKSEKPLDKEEVKILEVKNGTTIKVEHPKVKRTDGSTKCLISLEGIHKYDSKSKDDNEAKAAESSKRFLQQQINKAKKIEVKSIRSEDDKEVAELFIDGKDYSKMFGEWREVFEVPPPPKKEEKPKTPERAPCVAPVININPIQIPSSCFTPSSCHPPTDEKPKKD